jgi:hypothetical protein
VGDGQQDAQGVVEERDERDLRWRGCGGEVVFAHDGDVDLGGAEGAQGRAAVQQDVVDHLVPGGEEGGVAQFEQRGHFGREEDHRGEERPEPHVTRAEPRDLGDLRLGEVEAIDDRLGVPDQQPARLGGVHALPRAAHELRAHPPFKQRHLPGPGGLGQPDRRGGRRERAVGD